MQDRKILTEIKKDIMKQFTQNRLGERNDIKIGNNRLICNSNKYKFTLIFSETKAKLLKNKTNERLEVSLLDFQKSKINCFIYFLMENIDKVKNQQSNKKKLIKQRFKNKNINL